MTCSSARTWRPRSGTCLKPQDISAVIVVGNKDTAISDILQTNHAWVLADRRPRRIPGAGDHRRLCRHRKAKTLYYYRGWSFNSPADLKANNDLVKEYNIRVGFRNQLNNEVNKAMTS